VKGHFKKNQYKKKPSYAARILVQRCAEAKKGEARNRIAVTFQAARTGQVVERVNATNFGILRHEDSNEILLSRGLHTHVIYSWE
jgi:hypothetical protein